MDDQTNATLLAQLAAQQHQIAQLQADLQDAIQRAERYRMYYQGSPVGIAATNATGGWLDVNDTLCQMFGYTRAELISQTWADLTHPADLPKNQAELLQMVRGEVTTLMIEKRYRHKAGHYFWASLRAQGHYQPDGQLDYVIVNIQDISDRRRTEDALRASEALYQSVIEASPDDITISDLSGVVQLVSPRALSLFGYDRLAELVGRPMQDFIAPEDQARVQQELALLLSDGPRPPGEYSAVRRDGSRFQVEASAQVIYDAVNQPTGFVIVVRDITERKRAEQELRDSEARYRHLSDGAPLPVVVTDAHTAQVLYANQRALDLFGVRREDAIGSNVTARYADPQDRQRLVEIIRTSGFVSDFEVHMINGQGRDLWVAVSASQTMFQGRAAFHAVYYDMTARKRAELALRASEERYRLLADHAPLAVAVVDMDSARVVYANAQAEALFDVAPGQAIGLAAADFYLDSHDRARLIEQLRVTGRLNEFVVPMKTSAGRVKWVSVTSTLTAYENRTAIHSVYVDVTDKLRVEQAEREQRALAEALRDTAAALNSSLDFGEVLEAILSQVARVTPHDAVDIFLLDRARNTARLLRHRSHWAPARAHELEQLDFDLAGTRNLREIAQTGQPVVIDDTRAVDGWVATELTDWIRSNVGVPISARGEVIGILSLNAALPLVYTLADAERLRAFADQAAAAIQNAQLHAQVQDYAAQLERRVTERTAELLDRQARLQAILDSVDEAIYFMDVEDHIQYANPATSRLTGFSLTDLLGRCPRDLWRTAETPAAVIAELDEALHQNSHWHGEVVNRAKNGRLYEAALSITALRDGADQPIGYVVAQRDLSHLKELDRLKSQFVHRIGHELRTPLTSVLIYLDLLEHGKAEKRDKYMQTLHREADRLRRLVEGFLRMATLDAAAPPELRPINLNDLIGELLVQRREQALARAQSVEPLLSSPLPPVLAEPVWLGEAIGRVLQNALDYTPAGGHITVQTAVVMADAQPWVCVSIMDTGPGLSAADQSHLFERFYRGDAARDYTVPGVGLSLSICDAIMRLMDGRITLETQVGKGSTFTLWLKLAN